MDVKEVFDKANTALEAKNLELALMGYLMIIEMFPDTEEAKISLNIVREMKKLPIFDTLTIAPRFEKLIEFI